MKWWRRLTRGPHYQRQLDELTAALRAGEHERAVTIATACVELAESIFGEHHAELVACLYAASSASLALGRYAEAAVTSERAIAIAAGDAEPPLHQLWEQRAAIADHVGDDEALLRALRGMIDAAADEPLVRATAHNRLGLALGRAASYGEAAAAFAAALDLREREGDTLAVAEVLHNAATFRDPTSDDDTALNAAAASFERALQIAGKHLTSDASTLEARIAHNFAVLRQVQQRDDDAVALFRRSLSAWERDHRPTDPALRPTLARLGRLLQATRRFDAAVPLLERALHIAEEELGADHEITQKLGIWLGDANSSTYR